MKLIMCCQQIEGRDFLDDLKFSYVAALFWKHTYPGCEAWVATNNAKDIPKAYRDVVKVMQFEYKGELGALARAWFMAAYAHSEAFDQDTVFTGHDVLVLQPFPVTDAKITISYRYHPTQPYCSDLMIIKKDQQDYARKTLVELHECMRWMPHGGTGFAADQLAWALTFGMPEQQIFNGEIITTPRRLDVTALPVDEYLFTPNDAFPSVYKNFTGQLLPPVSFLDMARKTALHFKGNRKNQQFEFAAWAQNQGIITVPTDFMRME